MLLSDFIYDLPPRLIAQEPAERRTGSRLMVVDRAGGRILHDRFENFKNYLSAGDCLVFNDTRVIPARLFGRKINGGGAAGGAGGDAAGGAGKGETGGGGAPGALVEALLVRDAGCPADGGGCPDGGFPADGASADGGGCTPDGASADGGGCAVWEAIMRPGKRLPAGARVEFGGGALRAVVAGVLPSGHRLLRFDAGRGEFGELLRRIGHIPFPPYIKKHGTDPERYQTVYSRAAGSVAAPTAGLHFTEEYVEGLRASGVETAYLTLHVGPGTFAPVKAENIEGHHMHSEYYRVGAEAAAIINKAKTAAEGELCAKPAAEGELCAKPASSGAAARPRVVCVGTTSVRTLESVAGDGGLVCEREGWTGIFIYPGYKFKCADALLTNFHLPGSTLLMLVCAFAGYDLTMEAYRRAVSEGYRFFSFGDAMLVL